MSKSPVSSIPLAVLLDAVGQKVTIVTMQNDEFTGTLQHVDMNCLTARLKTVLSRQSDGFLDASASVVIPGANIKYFSLPSFMKNGPFFAELRGTAADGGGLLAKLTSTKPGNKKNDKKKKARHNYKGDSATKKQKK